MKISRELQKVLLEHLSECYPSSSDEFKRLGDPATCDVNLFYLEELGLVKLASSRPLSGVKKVIDATITSKGIDFLAEDGGISAILGTITVRLHEDTLLRLIEAKLDAAKVPDPEKKGILKALREAPAETTKQLITKLVDLGMENAEKAIPLLQTLIQSGHS